MLTTIGKYPPFTPVHQPFAHQQEVLDISKDRKGYGLLMEMGTGKTKVAIDNIVYLFLKGEIDGVLIVAPKGCYLNWLPEIEEHFPKHIQKRVAVWDSNANQTEVRILWSLTQAKDDILDIVLMNVEALSTERAEFYADKYLKFHYPMFIIDESSCIKNPRAERTKACHRLRERAEYRRILTGTPMTQGPLDLWAQFYFLDPEILGYDRFIAFKNYYAEFRRIEFGNRSFEKITKYKNIDELKRKISRHSYRKLKSECLDLPEKIFQHRTIELSPNQHKMYNQMKEEALIEFSESSMVSSTSVLTTIVKLHQICCGHVKDDTGAIIKLPNSRISELLNILNEISDKVIIWCKFIQDILNVSEALAGEYGDDSFVTYYGQTSMDERQQNIKRFRTDPNCRFFISNETGSKSLTLIEAPYAINYSYDYKLETWLQQQDRNHRIGQTKNVTYITIVANKTVDEKVIKALMTKRDLAATVLDDWKDLLV